MLEDKLFLADRSIFTWLLLLCKQPVNVHAQWKLLFPETEPDGFRSFHISVPQCSFSSVQGQHRINIYWPKTPWKESFTFGVSAVGCCLVPLVYIPRMRRYKNVKYTNNLGKPNEKTVSPYVLWCIQLCTISHILLHFGLIWVLFLSICIFVVPSRLNSEKFPLTK